MRSQIAGSLLGAAILVSQTNALTFAVKSVDCTQLQWTLQINQTEWSLTNSVELFFSAATRGAQDYSLLFSALPGGPVPAAGTWEFATSFGATTLNGTYSMGVELLDASRTLVAPSASNDFLQTMATDSRTYTFNNCSAQNAAAGTVVSASSVVSTIPTSTAATSIAFSTAVSPTSTALSASSASAAAVTPSSTAASSVAAAAAANKSKPMTHAGAIAGGVIGGLVAVVVLLGLYRYLSKRKRGQNLASDVRHHKAIVLTRRTSPSADVNISERKLEEGAVVDRYTAHGPRSDNSHSAWSSFRSPSGAPSVRSGANPFEDGTPEVTMIQVPFQLSTPRHPMQHDASLNRLSGTLASSQHSHKQVGEDDASSSDHGSMARSARNVSPPRPAPSFKIPRVTVPTYVAQQDTSSPPQTTRRASAGVDSIQSVEDPFVDARQDI